MSGDDKLVDNLAHLPVDYWTKNGSVSAAQTLPDEKRFTTIPLPDTQAAVAASHNFRGTIEVRMENGKHFYVKVETGRAVITEMFDHHDN